MLIRYVIDERTEYPNGAYLLAQHDCGEEELRSLLLRCARDFNIRPRETGDDAGWWESSYHLEDTEFFERGWKKYYTLSLPLEYRTGLRRERINRLLRVVW